MVIHTFAAIDVGSYELGMKIFEISRSKGIREIDHVVRKIDLGTDTYNTGKISLHHVQEVRDVLREYHRIMDTYRVEDYQAYGTSAIREMKNASVILSQWEQETGIHVDVLANSEQRFLDYKSLAYCGEQFDTLLDEGCAVVDIGGSSTQISLFDQGVLKSTENLKIGVLRLRDMVSRTDTRGSKMTQVLEEIVSTQIASFADLYLRSKKVRHIAIVDDYISSFMESQGLESIETEKMLEMIDTLSQKRTSELAYEYNMTEDTLSLLRISGVIIQNIVKTFGSETIYAPGVTLADGIAYEYAERRNLLQDSHDFEEDIVSCARTIAARYHGNEKRNRSLDIISMKIFDATKKIHGLGKRERLLLRLACILQDCGKFISISDASDCSYNIIMKTEIIGLSHMERKIIAYVVYYNHSDFVYFEQMQDPDLTRAAYLVITKLTAILKLATGLDRTHKGKFDDLRVAVRNDKLMITVKRSVDLSLEKGLLKDRADFFAEVFGITPSVKQR